MFHYRSELVLSKSWLNRALIIQSYGKTLPLNFNSDSEDVINLQKALSDLENSKNEFNLGQGGTSFRFFCFLVSRYSGVWSVKAHPRLLERPQKSLQQILSQLGVQVEFHPDRVQIISDGWKIPKSVDCQAKDSSQFVSGLLLNAWNLENDFRIKIQRPIASEDYLEMTLKMLSSFGMRFHTSHDQTERTVLIDKKQKPNLAEVKPEVDISSAFSLAAAGVIDGSVEILNWNSHSIQPDSVFLKLFDQMQISYSQTSDRLKVEKQNKWKSVRANLNSSPDLFPVLAVLCALADGESDLFGAEQLRHKESDRLQKTKELLDLVGFRSELKKDGLKIHGLSSPQNKRTKIIFNPDHDHRMAMAAGLLKLAGYNIHIQTPDVIQKSYPDFWRDIGVQP